MRSSDYGSTKASGKKYSNNTKENGRISFILLFFKAYANISNCNMNYYFLALIKYKGQRPKGGAINYEPI